MLDKTKYSNTGQQCPLKPKINLFLLSLEKSEKKILGKVSIKPKNLLLKDIYIYIYIFCYHENSRVNFYIKNTNKNVLVNN